MASDNVVHLGDLTQQGSNDLRLREAEPCHDKLFQGHLGWLRLSNGLSVHSSDCLELHNFTTEVGVKPQLSFVLFLEGHSEVAYGDRWLDLGRCCEHRQTPQAVSVVLAEPTLFSRRAQRGKRIRKVSVSLAPEWFEAGGLDGRTQLQELTGPRHDPVRIQQWQPSARLLALAEQMLNPVVDNPLLERLHQESRALELASEALGQLCGQPRAHCEGLRPHEYQRIRRTLDLLHSGQADAWSLEQIAREVGINVSTLQRQFQASQGVSLHHYQRRRKLTEAREALARQGISVQQAAWLAGYNSAANFATAFKREFGLSPKQVRARL